MPRFVLIGVGSAVFGAGTIRDLLHFKEQLPGATLALVDTDPRVLEQMQALARQLNREEGSPFTIEASTDRRAVLEGANFVVTSPAIKREQLWKRDWDIVKRSGIRQTYGENGGPGALLLTLRNVPMILSIARDMQELAPDAWLINYTNPEARICMALDRHSSVRYAGLCHQIMEGYRIVAGVTGIPVEDLDIKAAGLNHFTWMYAIHRRSTGENLYPLFRERLQTQPPEFQPLSRRMFALSGLFPTPGDQHLAEMLAWGWETQGLEGRDFRAWAERKQRTHELVGEIIAGRQPAAALVPGLSGERMAHMAVAMLHNSNSYEISVDLRNDGAIPNLPHAAIVETPGVVSGMGITALRMPPLPEVLAALMRRQIEVQELSVEAAVTGNRNTALRALALDPVVDSLETAETVLDRLLQANREYISQEFFS